LYSAFQKVDEDLSDSTNKWLQQIGLGSEHATEFLQHYNEYHCHHTTQCLLLGNFNCYVPTGNTPIRRQFEFPHHLARSRSESEILSQYRNNNNSQSLDLSQDQGDLEEQGEDNPPLTDLDNSPDDISSNLTSKQSPRKTLKSSRGGPGRGGVGDVKKLGGKGSRVGEGGRENTKRLPSVKTQGRSSDPECPPGGTQKGTTTTTTQSTSGREGHRTRLGELTNLVKT